MSRKPAFALIAAVLTAMLAAPATAQDSGWYLTGSVGSAHYSIDLDSQVREACLHLFCGGRAMMTDSSATTYRLGGGYRVNPYLALELNWVDLGRATSYFGTSSAHGNAESNGKYRLDGYQASLVGRWPVAANFALLGKLGVFAARLRYGADGTSNIIVPTTYSFQAPTENSNKTTFGLGVEYRLDPHWSLRADWDRYRGIGNPVTFAIIENGRFDHIDSLTVGASFAF
jgi:opacity protein-like surface antigen